MGKIAAVGQYSETTNKEQLSVTRTFFLDFNEEEKIHKLNTSNCCQRITLVLFLEHYILYVSRLLVSEEEMEIPVMTNIDTSS